MSKVITIHQPNFFPWLGFFNKINNADTWVVLDHVENNPRESSFLGRRVKLLINKTEKWVSVPLKKPEEKGIIGIPINKMQINESVPKLMISNKLSIEQSYKKYPFFNTVFPLVENYFNSTESSLMKRNMNFINEVLQKLEIQTEIIYSSSLNCNNKSTNLLIEIIKKVNGTHYLAGEGARKYQIDDLFKEQGITLTYNNFKHPEYIQPNTDTFIPGLSIIDVLMNIGFEGAKAIL